MKKAHKVSFSGGFCGRSTRIRTLDPLVPNQVRYQTAPHSDKFIIIAATFARFLHVDIFLLNMTIPSSFCLLPTGHR